MKILLMDGRILLIPAGKYMREENRGKEIVVLGSRNRELATLTAANIVAWWWDNADVRIETDSFHVPSIDQPEGVESK